MRDFFAASTSSLHSEEPPRTVQRIRICREPPRRKERRSNAIFRSPTNMQRFSHGTEITANARSETGSDAETAAKLVGF